MDSTVNYRKMSAGGPEIFSFRTKEDLIMMLAEKIQNLIRDTLISGRDFNIALSGGSTPGILFEYIVNSDQRDESGIWEKVRFYWVDERCVPPDHPESNYRMANDTLLSNLPHSDKYVFRMKGEMDPQTEAARYSQLLKGQLPSVNNLPVFDLVLLGMGKDGHTASIFPDQMELLSTENLCDIGVHPESGQHRLTLTGKVINNADHVFFLVTGADKATTVAEILGSGPQAENFPASHIKPVYGNLLWFLDDPAASLLQT